MSEDAPASGSMLLRPSDREALVRLATKLFGSTYAALKVLALLRTLVQSRRSGVRKALGNAFVELFRLDADTIKTSLFVALYPSLYKALRIVRMSPRVHHLPRKPLPSGLALLPLVLLLPSNIVSQLNLYSISAVLLALVRLADSQGKLERVPSWLKKGGGWWLFPLTQAWLLHLSVFEPYAFPETYRKIIVNRSSRYLPQHKSVSITPSPYPDPNTLLTLLPAFSYAPLPYPATSAALKSSQYSPFHSSIRSAHPSHRRALCATLHPNEPDCYKNFGHAVWEAWPGSAALVGGYSAVVMLAKARASVVKHPRAAIKKWLESTVRGASFISLAISTAWVMVCVSQRLLSPETLRRTRFALGGFTAGLWIFLVPVSRRLELGMYTLRLSMLSGWNLGVGRGWWRAKKSLEGLPFAVCLAVLLQLHQRDPGLVEGWVGKVTGWLEQRPRASVQDEKGLPE